MKTTFLILIGINTFLFSSCKKNFDVGSNTNSPYTDNPTSYILKSQVWSGPTTNGLSYLYTYNNNHLITSIKEIDWRMQTDNGTSSQKVYDTTYNTFEYMNGLCSKATERINEFNAYYTYEYNSNRLLIKRISVTINNPVKTYSFYKYDSLNNLIEQRDSSDRSKDLIYRHEFTYDENNNLISEIDSTLFLSPKEVSKTEWSAFDDKVNYLKSINGLPAFFTEKGSEGDNYTFSNKDNPITSCFYYPIAVGQSFNDSDVINNTIEYNEEKLPIKLYSGPWVETFEYEKYK